MSQNCAFREKASAHTLQQCFCHHPQCAIELNVRVDAVNGTGVDTFSSGTATGNSAFQHILLDGLICAPQVLTVILPASWCQNVSGGDRMMFITITVSQCRLCQRLACRWRQNQRLHGITLLLYPVKHAHHLVSPLDNFLHYISPVWHPDFSQRLTADQAIGADGTKISG